MVKRDGLDLVTDAIDQGPHDSLGKGAVPNGDFHPDLGLETLVLTDIRDDVPTVNVHHGKYGVTGPGDLAGPVVDGADGAADRRANLQPLHLNLEFVTAKPFAALI